jgi:hypothetical protein
MAEQLSDDSSGNEMEEMDFSPEGNDNQNNRFNNFNPRQDNKQNNEMFN